MKTLFLIFFISTSWAVDFPAPKADDYRQTFQNIEKSLEKMGYKVTVVASKMGEALLDGKRTDLIEVTVSDPASLQKFKILLRIGVRGSKAQITPTQIGEQVFLKYIVYQRIPLSLFKNPHEAISGFREVFQELSDIHDELKSKEARLRQERYVPGTFLREIQARQMQMLLGALRKAERTFILTKGGIFNLFVPVAKEVSLKKFTQGETLTFKQILELKELLKTTKLYFADTIRSVTPEMMSEEDFFRLKNEAALHEVILQKISALIHLEELLKTPDLKAQEAKLLRSLISQVGTFNSAPMQEIFDFLRDPILKNPEVLVKQLEALAFMSAQLHEKGYVDIKFGDLFDISYQLQLTERDLGPVEGEKNDRMYKQRAQALQGRIKGLQQELRIRMCELKVNTEGMKAGTLEGDIHKIMKEADLIKEMLKESESVETKLTEIIKARGK